MTFGARDVKRSASMSAGLNGEATVNWQRPRRHPAPVVADHADVTVEASGAIGAIGDLQQRRSASDAVDGNDLSTTWRPTRRAGRPNGRHNQHRLERHRRTPASGRPRIRRQRPSSKRHGAGVSSTTTDVTAEARPSPTASCAATSAGGAAGPASPSSTTDLKRDLRPHPRGSAVPARRPPTYDCEVAADAGGDTGHGDLAPGSSKTPRRRLSATTLTGYRRTPPAPTAPSQPSRAATASDDRRRQRNLCRPAPPPRARSIPLGTTSIDVQRHRRRRRHRPRRLRTVIVEDTTAPVVGDHAGPSPATPPPPTADAMTRRSRARPPATPKNSYNLRRRLNPPARASDSSRLGTAGHRLQRHRRRRLHRPRHLRRSPSKTTRRRYVADHADVVVEPTCAATGVHGTEARRPEPPRPSPPATTSSA